MPEYSEKTFFWVNSLNFEFSWEFTKKSKRVTLMYEQIYNLTSMFFKSLKGNLMYEFLISKFNGKRGPKRKLSLEQIVALNIYRFHFKMGDLKNYHKMIKELMSDKVPNLPNMEMNRKKESEIHYMDSTLITVCTNHKIYSHKVTKGIAKRSKSI